ncbi:MAG: hypothetical protein ACO1PW_12860, partial [Actinomycetota bacterium]
VGAVLLRRRPEDAGALLFPVLGGGLLLTRSVLEWSAVPGLLPAFAVGIAGLVFVRGPVWGSTTTRLLLGVVGAFCIAVIATQYRLGGHTEWGGRYFALAVPLAGAVAASSLAQALDTWPSARRRVFGVGMTAAVLGLAILAVRTVDAAHSRNLGRVEGVLAAASELPDPRPVVVSEDEQIPRLARENVDDVRFLNVPPAYLNKYLGRLAAAGERYVLLVSRDPAVSLDRVPQSYEVVGAIRPHGLQWRDGGGLITLQLRER